MHRFLPAVALLSLLAACSSGSGPGPSGGNGNAPPLETPINPPPTGPVTPAGPPPAGTFTFAPRQGLEMLDPVSTTSAGSITRAPNGSLVTTVADLDVSAGFTLNFQDFATDRGAITYPAAQSGTRTFTACSPCVGPEGANYFTTTFTGGAPSTLDYATYGTWAHYTDAFDREKSYGVFATGLRTGSDRPTTGRAVYVGSASGFISTAAGNRHSFTGMAILTANFETNGVAGTIEGVTTTQIRAQGVSVMNGQRGTANNISLAPGTLSGTGFTGAAVAVAPEAGAVNPSINLLGAAGAYGGNLYGPGAVEVAGSLSLTGAGVTVIGAFGGTGFAAR